MKQSSLVHLSKKLKSNDIKKLKVSSSSLLYMASQLYTLLLHIVDKSTVLCKDIFIMNLVLINW